MAYNHTLGSGQENHSIQIVQIMLRQRKWDVIWIQPKGDDAFACKNIVIMLKIGREPTIRKAYNELKGVYTFRISESNRTTSTLAIDIYRCTHFLGAIFTVWDKLANHSRRLKPSSRFVKQGCAVEYEFEKGFKTLTQE